MARKRNKDSTGSFSNLGLDPEEDAWLIKHLGKKDMSCQQFVRALIRKYREVETKKA